MKITIERTANLGQVPITVLFVDGKEVGYLDSSLSRSLTDTTNESDRGIFSSSFESLRFNRQNGFVYVDFGYCFPEPSDIILSDIKEEINRRVRLVREAFNEKYPAMNHSITFEIN